MARDDKLVANNALDAIHTAYPVAVVRPVSRLVMTK
jgi:hypothetical protein